MEAQLEGGGRVDRGRIGDREALIEVDGCGGQLVIVIVGTADLVEVKRLRHVWRWYYLLVVVRG